MNARFWEWINGGWVKLTLRRGQCLAHHTHRTTDEGWESKTNLWFYCNDFVTNTWVNRSKDCDGRLDSGGSVSCHVMGLRKRDMWMAIEASENRGIFSPDWKKVDGWQRDHAAEAMGY